MPPRQHSIRFSVFKVGTQTLKEQVGYQYFDIGPDNIDKNNDKTTQGVIHRWLRGALQDDGNKRQPEATPVALEQQTGATSKVAAVCYSNTTKMASTFCSSLLL